MSTPVAELPPAKDDSDLRGRTPSDLPPPEDALLDVRGLKKHFPIRRGFLSRVTGHVRAVDGVTFWIRRGETLGLVGESGSGKTTTGRTLLRLIEPTAGSARFRGRDIFEMDDDELRSLRRHAQIIFQDPFGSLNPRMTVGDALREVLGVHDLARGAEADRRVDELLERVGLSPDYSARYPHEFSGGQRQRIGIARALSVEPEFIVCDEPVSALDVSVQAQVLNLLRDLQDRLALAYLFIAHDLSVVEHVSDRIAVMYLGRIVELGATDDVIASPRHPYTRALLSAVPVAEPSRDRAVEPERRPDGGRAPRSAGPPGAEAGAPEAGRAAERGEAPAAGSSPGESGPTRPRERIVLPGDVPSPESPPSGCPFHPRCPHPLKDADCARLEPPLAEKGPEHFAACIKEPAYVPPLDT